MAEKDTPAARAVEEIRQKRAARLAESRRRQAEDRARWNAQAERMAARGRAADQTFAPKGPKFAATQLPPEKGASCPQSGKAGAVLEVRHGREGGRGITYERKAVLCGKKGCNKLHGPYWYAFWSAGGRVRSVYIGKKFLTVEEKCPERLKAL